MHVGFYAPLKSPNHPVPSGDRLMARLLMQAMRLAGYTVSLVSEFRSFSPTPDDFALRRVEGEQEAARVAAEWQAHGAPDVFFCYHPYYKSPDFLGPRLTRRLGIPYVTAEASFSLRRTTGEWAQAQAFAMQGLRAADINICITRRDREGLERIVPVERLTMLPPFLDLSRFLREMRGGSRVGAKDTHSGEDKAPRLITVAMMRPGDKLESYRMLAKALAVCLDMPWRLTIVGDGPCRDEVRGMFAALPEDRLMWRGELPDEQVASALAASDVYVWPGFGEAYGLAYLEAQASGLPVIAQEIAGVPEVVIDGRTGLLTETGNADAFANAMRRLISDEGLRARMGVEARRFVTSERSLEKAAATMKSILARFEA